MIEVNYGEIPRPQSGGADYHFPRVRHFPASAIGWLRYERESIPDNQESEI
jgi:hypothetical protein